MKKGSNNWTFRFKGVWLTRWLGKYTNYVAGFRYQLMKKIICIVELVWGSLFIKSILVIFGILI